MPIALPAPLPRRPWPGPPPAPFAGPRLALVAAVALTLLTCPANAETPESAPWRSTAGPSPTGSAIAPPLPLRSPVSRPPSPEAAGLAAASPGALGFAAASVPALRVAAAAPALDAEAEAYLNDKGRFLGVLASWSALSVTSGAAIWASGQRFERYVGIQFVAWGAIDGLLAGVGLRQLPAERAALGRERAALPERRAKFRRTLLVNALADAAYISAGALLFGLGKNDAVRGTGAGFVAQGAFLLALDNVGVLYFLSAVLPRGRADGRRTRARAALEETTMKQGTRKAVGAAALALGVALVGGGGWLALKPPSTATPPAPSGAAPAFSTAPPIESLAKQYPSLEAALNDPRLASVVQEFLGAYQKGGVEGARAFAKERGLLTARDELAFTVLFEGGDTAAFEAELKRAGGRVTGRGDNQLDVALPWASLEKAAAEGQGPEQVIGRLSRITNVRGVLPLERASRPDQTGRGPPTTPAPTTSRVEGVSVTHANLWHAAGFRGRGVRVGILDPEVSRTRSFAGRALPATVTVFNGDCVANGRAVDDEGTHGPAAAEIIHAMAPEAELFVACSLGDRDASVDWLLRQGVKIISHSAGGMYGPRNGQGAFQKRIDQLAQRGVLWVNAAGNSGLSFHRGQLTGGADGYWHVFPSGRQGLGFRTNGEGQVDVTMLWAQWEGTVSDYDLYLFDAQGRELGRSANRNDWLRQPRENVGLRLRPNTDYQLAVRGRGSTRPTVFVIEVHGASRVDSNDPNGSINAPGDAAGSLTVGAALWNGDALAPYSSRGPTEDGRLKPDISAPTETMSLVYGGRFGGTSAATPHVAGAAALVWGRYPTLSRDDLVRFLFARAADRGPAGPDAGFGVGRLDLGAPGETAAPPPPPQPVAVAPPTIPPPAAAPPTAPPGLPARDDDEGFSFGSLLGALAITGLGALLLVAGFLALLLDRLRGAMNRGPRLAVPGGYGPPGAYGPAGAPPHAPPGAHAQRGAHTPPAGHPQRGATPPQAHAHRAAPAGAPAPRPAPTPAPHSPAYNPPGRVSGPAAPASLLSAVLVGLEGPLAGQTLTLKPGGDTLIGRAPGSDVLLPISTVSSKHAKISFAQNAYHIGDAGSANGTFVNGQRVTSQPLCSGDEIAVGGARFRFERR